MKNEYEKGSIIAAIKEKLSIEDAAARYLPEIELKHKGRKLWCCCPFHSERTASFMLDPTKDKYYCFGCNSGGDQINLVAKATGKTLQETINMLTVDLGICGDLRPEARLQRKKAVKLSRTADRFMQQVNEAWTATAKLNRRAERILRAIKTEQDLQMPIVEWSLKQQSILEGTLDLLESEDPADQWMGLKWYRRILMNE